MVWTHDMQMAFERADLNEEEDWFASHFGRYEQEMAAHALASFPVFQWRGFRAWLGRNRHLGRAGELCDLFEELARRSAHSGSS